MSIKGLSILAALCANILTINYKRRWKLGLQSLRNILTATNFP